MVAFSSSRLVLLKLHIVWNPDGARHWGQTRTMLGSRMGIPHEKARPLLLPAGLSVVPQSLILEVDQELKKAAIKQSFDRFRLRSSGQEKCREASGLSSRVADILLRRSSINALWNPWPPNVTGAQNQGFRKVRCSFQYQKTLYQAA